MSGINAHTYQTVADLAALTYRDIDNLKLNGNQKTVITVSGKAYKVSHVESTDTFKVKRHRKHLSLSKSKGASATIKAELEGVDQKRPSKLLLPLLRTSVNNQTMRVGMYGFHKPRAELHKLLKADNDFKLNVKMESIDQYNACLGIKFGSINEETYFELLDCISSGSLETRIDEEEVRKFAQNPKGEDATDDQFNEQLVRVKAWCKLLENNVDKLKIDRLISNEEKGLQSIKKNLAPGLIDESKKGQKHQSILKVAQAINNRMAIDNSLTVESNRVFSMIRMAFIRQISKLGLEFFSQQGNSVIFAWTHADENYTTMDQPFLDEKPWKKQGNDETSRGAYSEAITLSEMRRVLRDRARETVADQSRVIQVDRYDNGTGTFNIL